MSYFRKQEVIPVDMEDTISKLTEKLSNEYQGLSFREADETVANNIKFFFSSKSTEGEELNLKVDRNDKGNLVLWLRDPKEEEKLKKQFNKEHFVYWSFVKNIEI